MSAVVNDSRENLAEFRAPGPGERLKAARVSLGLEPARIAAQLHLSTDMVRAIERDDYSSMPARVFVRGYIKNYARVVGLPTEGLLKQLEDQFPDEAATNGLNRVGTDMRRELRSSHGIVRVVTWLIVLGLGLLFVLWWYGYLDWRLQTNNASISDTSDPASTLTTSNQDGVLTLPGNFREDQPGGLIERPQLPAPDDTLTSTAFSAVTETPAPLQPQVDDPPPIAEPSVASIVSDADNAASSATTVTVIDEVAEESASSSASPATDVSSDASTHGSGIVVAFTAPCWVDIRDSGNRYRLYGEMAGGRTETLGGEPPYKLIIGNAEAASIRIDGQPYDLAPHTNGNVARLTLGTD